MNPPPPPDWKPYDSPVIVQQLPERKKQKQKSYVGWVIAAGVFSIAAIVGIVLGLDEFRVWRAKERVRAEARQRTIELVESQLRLMVQQEKDFRDAGNTKVADYKRFAIDGFRKHLVHLKADTYETPKHQRWWDEFESELNRRTVELDQPRTIVVPP
jgi:hypothetical protein